MKRALIAALACAMLSVPAEARPKHHSQRIGNASETGIPATVCSDPVMRPCSSKYSKVTEVSFKSDNFHKSSIRPRAWCGWWLGRYLGMTDRKLWLARNWAHVGRPAHGPAVGTIVVWRHHVGVIKGRTSAGQWIVHSGNDGGRVRTRPRSVSNAIAFRWP